MGLIVDIADAVVEELNTGSFSQTFTAARYYQPTFDLPEMQDLHVSVVPKSVEVFAAGRDRNQHDYAIDIAVQKKVDGAEAESPADIDDLMTLVEEIADHLRFKRLDGFNDAAWLKIQNEPVFAGEHLNEMRQFTSILTVTYRVLR